MTMVANTGFLMAMRVIHMFGSPRLPWVSAHGRRRGGGGHGLRRVGGGAGDDARLRALLQVVEARAEHEGFRLHALEDLGAPAQRIAPARDDRAAQQLALLD